MFVRNQADSSRNPEADFRAELDLTAHHPRLEITVWNMTTDRCLMFRAAHFDAESRAFPEALASRAEWATNHPRDIRGEFVSRQPIRSRSEQADFAIKINRPPVLS